MWTYRLCLEYLCYIGLLLFMIPLEYNKQDDIEKSFENYLQTFNKTYNNKTEYQLRLSAFQNSLQSISLLNENKAAHYGLTKFSDLQPEEFLQNHVGRKTRGKFVENTKRNVNKVRLGRSLSKLPDRIDWREQNAITKVKDQKNCGACWAYSAIETIEAMNAIKTGKLLDFSVQQMIDCSPFTYGCKGGDICSLLEWLKSYNISIQLNKAYPMTWRTDVCHNKTTSSSNVTLTDYICENYIGNEEMILRLLASNGPVAVAINAQSWQHYIGGVIQFHCETNPKLLNHAVQLIGYDLTAPVPYYIAKNTWGSDFGEDGYLKLAIFKNICGLAYEVAAATID